jgi:crotonobetainyl-CoA hydratase
MTGRRMSAEEAARWGLVNAVVDSSPGGAMGKARELAALLASGPPLALAAIKAVVRATETLDTEQCYALMRSGKLAAFEAMLASEDAKEGPRAFAEKRDPVWQGK